MTLHPFSHVKAHIYMYYEHEGEQAYIPRAIYTSRAEGPRSICEWCIRLYARVRVVYNIYTYWLKLETRSKIFRALRKKKTEKEMTEGNSLSLSLSLSFSSCIEPRRRPTLSSAPDIVSAITLVCYNLATRLRRFEVDSALAMVKR